MEIQSCSNGHSKDFKCCVTRIYVVHVWQRRYGTFDCHNSELKDRSVAWETESGYIQHAHVHIIQSCRWPKQIKHIYMQCKWKQYMCKSVKSKTIKHNNDCVYLGRFLIFEELNRSNYIHVHVGAPSIREQQNYPVDEFLHIFQQAGIFLWETRS